MEQLDFVVIGAGVVGLAVAAELAAAEPEAGVAVLERHGKFGQETSSRSSEVIHAGLYYPAGSLKARLCVEGNRLLYEFCEKHGVAYRRLGKLVIARDENDVASVEQLLTQGRVNGVPGLEWLDQAAIGQLEPHVCAVGGLYSPNTGIVDSHGLMAKLERLCRDGGAMLSYKHEVTGLVKTLTGFEVHFVGPDGLTDSLACHWVINCAGLGADRIAALAGIDVEAAGYRIYPAKGEYFALSGPKAALVTRLIYPPPLAGLKGLGTHITKSLDGRARLGPNAFYVDEIDYDVDPKHRDEFFAAAKSFLPFIEPDDLSPDTAGIRPKIQSPTATDVCDFVICRETDRGLEGLVNLVGIESPGLTASLSIARYIRQFTEEE